jgi:signal transduction histidine kinase
MAHKVHVSASSAMAIRPLTLAFELLAAAPRASWPDLVVNWATFAVKRTKTAMKRTSTPLEMRGMGSRALSSLSRDKADLRACRPRADGTYMNTDNSIALASGRTLSKATLFWVLHCGAWFGFGAFVLAFNIAEWGLFPSIMDEFVWVAGGFTLSLGLRGVFRRARAAGWSYLSLGMLALTLSTLVAPIWYALYLALLREALACVAQWPDLHAMFAHEATEAARLPWWIPIGYWNMFSSILLTWSSLYFGVNAMLDLETERARSVGALKLADSARLRALQSQLNPHFLFNALNGIATLIREGDRTSAADTVDTLSDFLRMTLQKLDSPEIPVREELAFVEKYLRIQRLRFGSSFRTTVDAEPGTLDALVPTLILQPLVENAVRHGVLARAQGGALSVSIRRRDAVLVITVEDDGPGLGDEGAHPYGVGFKNSAERLAALYGDEAHMSVGARPYGPGFVVVVFLPFRQAPGMPADQARVTAEV